MSLSNLFKSVSNNFIGPTFMVGDVYHHILIQLEDKPDIGFEMRYVDVTHVCGNMITVIYAESSAYNISTGIGSMIERLLFDENNCYRQPYTRTFCMSDVITYEYAQIIKYSEPINVNPD